MDFQALIERLPDTRRSPEDADLLRRARIRIADSIMPPAGEDQPSAEERANAIPAFAAAAHVARTDIVPAPTSPRRLNRVEYANTVRDLFGVDISDLGSLPPDDVGAGFDNVAAVLSLSPASFERMMDLAELVAQRACPERDAPVPAEMLLQGRQLQVQGDHGRASGQVMAIWSNGTADCAMELPRDGVYQLIIKAHGMQAGPDKVRMAATVDGKAVANFLVAETERSPGVHSAELELRGGPHRVGVAFLNDYYVKGPPAQDRNLAVHSLTIRGPLDRREDPAWRAQLDAQPSVDAKHAWLVRRVLRRPSTSADVALLQSICADVEGTHECKTRAAIVALLVHPEFLFWVEQSPATAGAVPLSSHELATRLSYFLWSSTPDAELSAAADSGALMTEQGRRQQVARMLSDARSSQLAERFAPQWLGIDGIEQRMPDPARFPGVDGALAQSMRSETVLLFDTVLREDREATQLLDADFTFVDARLAAHYGMPSPGSSSMRRVPVTADRGGGVLAHASVLLSTSNPTRTSPVKRGKWVLESLLDCAPPPPPPGAPALPERAEDRHGLTLRQSLERHRADPSCAACHLRMDAMGFAFEHYDAVGRKRDRADGAEIDSVGELPDGRVVASIQDLRALLVRDPDFVRSLTKHLLVYATGRAAGPPDQAAVDLIVRSLGPTPTLRNVVVAVTESPAFLCKGATPTMPPSAPEPVGVAE